MFSFSRFQKGREGVNVCFRSFFLEFYKADQIRDSFHFEYHETLKLSFYSRALKYDTMGKFSIA